MKLPNYLSAIRSPSFQAFLSSKFVLASMALLLLSGLSSQAQTNNIFTMAVQQSASFQATRSYSTSLMAGIRAADNSRIYIGGTIKRFTQEVGHSRTQLGLRTHAQSPIGDGKITPFLEAYALKGQYYIYEEMNGKEAFVKKAIHIGGIGGIGYMFNENLGLFAGYAIREYNPIRYKKQSQSPYNTGAVTTKLSYSFTLGEKY